MKRILPTVLVAVLAGCASGGERAAEPDPAADGPMPLATAVTAEAFADLDLRIECDRVRVTVPERLRDRAVVPASDAPGPWDLSVGSVRIHVREIPPAVAFSGEDCSVVADGIVHLRRTEGRFTTEEGPYRTVILRNGRMLAR